MSGMIANVTLEGIVTGDRWQYGGARLFRLAHYRPSDRRPEYMSGGRQKADFFTVRILPTGISMEVPEEGAHIVVEGYPLDRQDDVDLGHFNRRARGEEKLPDSILATFGDLSERRSITEFVAERIRVLSNGSNAPKG